MRNIRTGPSLLQWLKIIVRQKTGQMRFFEIIWNFFRMSQWQKALLEMLAQVKRGTCELVYFLFPLLLLFIFHRSHTWLFNWRLDEMHTLALKAI